MQIRLGSLLFILLLLVGCGNSNQSGLHVKVQKRALIPVDKRNIYIKNITLDDMFLKVSLQTAIFNAPKIDSQSYLVLNNKKDADVFIDVKILKDEYKSHYFNKRNYPSDTLKRCKIHNYSLKVLFTAFDKNTKEVFASDVFSAYQQTEDCDRYAISKEEMKNKAVKRVVEKIIQYIIPEPFNVFVNPLRSVDSYDKEDAEMFNEAITLLDNESYVEAKELFLKLSYRKNDYTTNYNLALCYEMLGNYSYALKYYEMASNRFIDSEDFNVALLSHRRVLQLME